MVQHINYGGYMIMNGFVEINETEMMNIDGGWDWGIVLGGTALFLEVVSVSHGVAVAAAAAAVPVSAPVVIALCAVSALSGSAVAYGATH